jgi:uncharacterized membrane protein (DUF2068 family)
VPFEIYELYHHPTPVKVLVLIINLAVVAYLIFRITHEPRHAQSRKVAH